MMEAPEELSDIEVACINDAARDLFNAAFSDAPAEPGHAFAALATALGMAAAHCHAVQTGTPGEAIGNADQETIVAVDVASPCMSGIFAGIRLYGDKRGLDG